MDVPFFVAFSLILLLGRYLPFALPPAVRAALVDTAAGPASTAKCAISVAVAGLALLVSTTHCSSSSSSSGQGHHHSQECQQSEVTMEMRALWFNCAALYLGVVLGGAAVALQHRPAARVPPFLQVAVDHLAEVTETVAITALARDACVLVKVLTVKQ
ncbi:hypothetical protein PR202_gb02996 [Eleusine coracana subsp. coracana]|uniref:Uncharacterized protein n=1 Tax=Eleusine coracana subsp. coracana TaxID=191504 RepID=A0AAV5E0L8_ELECO|nr:hypothetical protein QOZ80_8BG0662150 [Eleusine coracana subsp. coracana]GJN16046.1 hypothetical protein PR202_gb02996 [Eleusine coracana subsp. coracana]